METSKPSRVYRNVRGCILQVHPKGLSQYVTMFVILFILTWWLKKRGQLNKGILILRWGFEAADVYQYSGFREISSRTCFLFFLDKIAFKCFLDLTIITGFFRSAWARFRMMVTRLVSMVDYGFDQWSIVSLLSRNFFCTYLC